MPPFLKRDRENHRGGKRERERGGDWERKKGRESKGEERNKDKNERERAESAINHVLKCRRDKERV